MQPKKRGERKKFLLKLFNSLKYFIFLQRRMSPSFICLQNNSERKTNFFLVLLYLLSGVSKRFLEQLSICEHQYHTEEGSRGQALWRKNIILPCYSTPVPTFPSMSSCYYNVVAKWKEHKPKNQLKSGSYLWFGQCVYPFWAPLFLHLIKWNAVANYVYPEKHLLFWKGLLQTIYLL